MNEYLKVFILLSVFTFEFAYSEYEICMDKRLLESYKQKQCTPILTGKNTKCPKFYRCPDRLSAPQGGCVFDGKTYKLGESVPKPNPCAICKCGLSNTISCVYTECPDDAFGVPPYPTNATQEEIKGKYKNCYYSYELSTCCGKAICPTDDDLAKGHKCVYDGVTYRSGEKIFPKSDVCKSCVCNEAFDAKNLDNAACRKVGCELNMKRVNRGCVPVNHEAHCCPIQYKCPLPVYEERQAICSLPPVEGPCDTPSEKFHFNQATKKCEKFTYSGCIGNKNNFETAEDCLKFCTAPKPTGPKDTKKCYFGEKSFAIGAKLVTNDDCLECVCLVPPDITCVNRC